jgi:energy-coupling factor transport system substrate-specific component
MQTFTHIDRRIRFLLAGGFAAGLSWVSRFLFSTVMPFPSAIAAATATGMVVGFLIYRSFVFPGSKRSLAAQLAGFLFVNLIGAVVTILAAVCVLTMIPAPLGLSTTAAAAAHAIGIGLGAVANYFGHKTITFRTP